jgi:cytosine/adenosine deaminase-related metal-dependent hydrolase
MAASAAGVPCWCLGVEWGVKKFFLLCELRNANGMAAFGRLIREGQLNGNVNVGNLGSGMMCKMDLIQKSSLADRRRQANLIKNSPT